jgi:hypothetical protein
LGAGWHCVVARLACPVGGGVAHFITAMVLSAAGTVVGAIEAARPGGKVMLRTASSSADSPPPQAATASDKATKAAQAELTRRRDICRYLT